MQSQKTPRAADLIREIRQGDVAPVYLLTGEAEYLIEAALERMLAHLLPPEHRDFNLTILTGAEATVEEIASIAATYPMLADRRVLLVRDPLFLKSNKQDSLLTLLREAMQASGAGFSLRVANLCARLLGISPGDIVDSATSMPPIQTFISEHEEQLSAEERDWLLDLPESFVELDLPSEAGAGNEQERLIQLLQRDLPSTTVVVFTVAGRLDSRTKLFKAFQEAGKVLVLELPKSGRDADPVYQLVSQKLRDAGKTISPRDLQRIRERTGDELHLLFEEIEKLISFIGTKARIEASDINQVVSKSSFDQVFALTDAIAKKDLSKALSSLHSTLAGGEPPIKIHAMVTRQIRLTLQAKLLVNKGVLPLDLGRMDSSTFNRDVYRAVDTSWRAQLPDSRQLNLLRQHPVSVYLLLKNLSHYTLAELQAAMERLLKADIELKSTSLLTSEHLLEELVIDLCNFKAAKAL